MTAVEKIQSEIQHLQPSERRVLRAWLAEFEDDEWDFQMEADGAAGKLDHLLAEVKADIEAGRTAEIKCDA